MPLILWDEKFSVGHNVIDKQHKKLFDLTNSLHDAIMVRAAASALGRSLKDLLDYTVYHFTAEENLMKANAYPRYAEHKALHDTLTQQAVDFSTRMQEGKAVSSLDFMQFLRDWLTQHIMEVDTVLGSFLKNKAGG
jgi:hemerythrin